MLSSLTRRRRVAEPEVARQPRRDAGAVQTVRLPARASDLGEPKPGHGGTAPAPPSRLVLPQPAPALGVRRPPSVDHRVDQPPPTARSQVERHFGADLTHVPVRRGRESAAAARRLRAQAFTAEGEVHVPAEVGPLDTGRGQALLRHELVHVVQQRRLATHGPVEASGQGQAFEAEAQRLAPAPDQARERWQSQPGVVVSETGAELARLRRLAGLAERPLPAAGQTTSIPAQPPPIQRAAETPQSAETAAHAEPSLEETLNRLYEQFSSRLRGELLIDRERAGTLADR